MKYNVNVYQIVLTDSNIASEKGLLFTRTMLGSTPSKEEFDSLYDNVISFDVDGEKCNINDIMEFCEHCFRILNCWNIDSYEEISNFSIKHQSRSLSVGDILEVNNELYLVKMSGFAKFPEEVASDDESIVEFNLC